ncbi:hypothetical protein PAPYR_12317 [Paratrimastix pyriformis]|uniref:C2H2-type domain-containing protein n=1 Tax=Paratrimastix pyriformis TaxID=342808 RepID=A0ABQ8U4D3_9EUKA|nr:hypothetical protein PAPYR_12317 [Paratrimastix pyriformis]
MLDDPMMMALFDGSVFYLRLIDVLLPSSATTDRKPACGPPVPSPGGLERKRLTCQVAVASICGLCAETFRQMTQARMQHDCVHAHCRFVRKEGNCFEKQHSRVNLWILQPRRLSPGDFTQ